MINHLLTTTIKFTSTINIVIIFWDSIIVCIPTNLKKKSHLPSTLLHIKGVCFNVSHWVMVNSSSGQLAVLYKLKNSLKCKWFINTYFHTKLFYLTF